jgi:hypothetical protein
LESPTLAAAANETPPRLDLARFAARALLTVFGVFFCVEEN